MRTVTVAYGKDVEPTAYVHEIADAVRLLEGVGLRVSAVLNRAPSSRERTKLAKSC